MNIKKLILTFSLVFFTLTSGVSYAASDREERLMFQEKEISELQNIESFDRHNVMINGWVRHIEFPHGRYEESRYTEMIVGEGEDEITVFFPTPIVGDLSGVSVSITGKYYSRGKYGGKLVDGDYIVGVWIERIFGFQKKEQK